MNTAIRVLVGHKLRMALYILGAILFITITTVNTAFALSDSEQQSCYDKYNGKNLNQQQFDEQAFQKCLDRNGGNCQASIGADDGGMNANITCMKPAANNAGNNANDKARGYFSSSVITAACNASPSNDCKNKVETAFTSCFNMYIQNGPNGQGFDMTAQAYDTNWLSDCVVNNAKTGDKTAIKAALDKTISEHSSELKSTATADTTNLPENTVETCRIDNIGWLVCPTAAFLSKITDGAYALVEKLLVFRVSEDPLSTDPQVNPVFFIWSNIRNLANVSFVIAFFVVIFSQATSIGLSSYGVRKMLPRIIVAAILVNLSYYICIFAVDISNIIGAGIDGIIRNVPFANDSLGKSLPLEGDGKWETITSGILAAVVGGIALGALAKVGLAILLPFILFAFLAIITAIVVLAARHALIIILIILSPLAFVAYILPNTEGLFSKWRKAFITMLIMYPLIAILFSGSRVAGQILMMMYEGNGFMSVLMRLFGLGVMAFPLFGVPYIVKLSGGLIGRIAGVVNDRSRGLIDRSRNFGKEHDKVKRAEFGQNLRDNKWGKRASKWGYGKNGSEDKGLGGRARRRFGRMFGATATKASGAANWQYDRKKERESRLEESNRQGEEQYWDRLDGKVNREDFMKNGVLDEPAYNAAVADAKKKADKMALRAAGVTGAEGAERIRRVAREKQKKEYLADIDRASSDFVANGAFEAGGYYYEFDDEGNVVAEHADHGRAMTAAAVGKNRVGVVRAGQERTIENAQKNMIDTRGWRQDRTKSIKVQAIMKHLNDIGDGAGIGYALYGDKSQGIEALADDQVSDFLSWVNAGKIAPKLSHLVTNDNGLNGVSAEAMVNWHGNEFAAAASRVRQLREQGKYGQAQKIQDAVENAFSTLSTDPNLRKDFKQKHVDAMARFNRIVSGNEGRIALREYGDSLRDADGRYTQGVITDEGDPNVGKILHPEGGKVNAGGESASLRFSNVTKDTKIEDILAGATEQSNNTSQTNPYANPAYGTGTANDPLRQQAQTQQPPIPTPDAGTLNIPHGGSGGNEPGTPYTPAGMSPEQSEEYHRRFGGGS